MEINPADIKKMTKEYEIALSSGENGDIAERLIVLEENQLECFDALLRNGRNGRTVNYLKNLTFRTLNILAVKDGQNAYIPSVRTPCSCSSPLSRILSTQLDIFVLIDKWNLPFSEKAEIIALENRKAALIGTL